MIRQFHKKDIAQIMKIWLESNMEVHNFIPKEYWESNYAMVQEQILQADLYVCEKNGEIYGFAGITDNYIAGIFVKSNYRSSGIGRQLLNYIKEIYASLSLSVYQKNRRAVDFYIREGFLVRSEGMDQETGEEEYFMIWNKEASNIQHLHIVTDK